MTIVDAIAAALLASFWQDTIVAGVLLAALTLLRRHAPQLRYLLACAALAAMAVLPVVTVVSRLTTATRAPHSSTVPERGARVADPPMPSPPTAVNAPQPSSPGTRPLSLPYQTWALALWCAGMFACSLRLLGAGAHTARMRRHSVPADDEMRHAVSRLAAAVGLPVAPDVRLSPLTPGPATVGWLRPLILLPPALALSLTPKQLEALLVHELAHIRRHDYIVNLAQLLVETVFFYHPAVWWVSQQIRAERELCCDDLAVSLTGNAAAYARALAQVARTADAPSMAVGADGGPLYERIARLLGQPRHAPAAPAVLVMAIGFVAGGVLASGSWLHAQSASRQPSTALDTATVEGTLYDPFGRPAPGIHLVLEGFSRPRSPEAVRPRVVSPEVTTDAGGHYRIAGVMPGSYALSAPTTDFVPPQHMGLSPGTMLTRDIHMEVEAVTARFTVCGDCPVLSLPPVANSVQDEIAADLEAAPRQIVKAAEPVDRWESWDDRFRRYPAALQRAALEGPVAIEGRIARDGSVQGLWVVSAAHPALAEAAMEAIVAQRWLPGRVRDEVVEVPLRVTIEYVLHRTAR